MLPARVLLITVVAALRKGMATSGTLMPGPTSGSGLHELKALGVLHGRPILRKQSTK